MVEPTAEGDAFAGVVDEIVCPDAAASMPGSGAKRVGGNGRKGHGGGLRG